MNHTDISKRKISVSHLALKISAILLCVCSLLCSCNANLFTTSEYLIKPPRLNGEAGEIEKAFEKEMSNRGEYILRFPSGGKLHSAYITNDCDGDGVNEAFVFYSLKSEETNVYMMCLSFKNGQWNFTQNFPGSGTDVYSVNFVDFNGDGIDEILVGWVNVDAKQSKRLTVYSSYKNSQNLNFQPCPFTRQNTLEPLSTLDFNMTYPVDVDYDSCPELLLLNIDSTADEYVVDAKLLKMTEKATRFTMNIVDSVPLYNETTSFLKVCSDMVDGQAHIYIDMSSPTLSLTEILSFNKDTRKLEKSAESDPLTISDFPTSRAKNLVCVEESAKILIPSTTLLKNSKIYYEEDYDKSLSGQGGSGIQQFSPAHTDEKPDDNKRDENVYLIKYLTYEKNNYKVEKSYIENTFDLFRFDIDENDNNIIEIYPDRHLTNILSGDKELLLSVTARNVDEELSSDSIVIVGQKHKYLFMPTEAGLNNGFNEKSINEKFSEVQ